ncbi:MAG: RNA polymerase sigma factor [Planctomycetes bacterium]|nr:RNA polymerase sigma factor [Planctomycetota bacterium]
MASVHPQAGHFKSAPGGSARCLSSTDFAARLEDNFRVLWLIAVGITRDSAAAEDVVQDAAVIALGKLGEFDPGTSFVAWMGQTVRFVAYNQRRKSSRRRIAPLEIDDGQGPAARPHEDPAAASDSLGRAESLSVNQGHFDDEVVRAVNSVNEQARSCLLLRTLAGLEYAEISAILGIPEGTAMSHVHRTRIALREHLTSIGYGPGGRTGGEA